MSRSWEVGDVMIGGTVSSVVESNLDGFAVGDFVLSGNGWQEYTVSDGRSVRKLDPSHAPISTAVGVLGMPGHTAYVGLLDIGKPQPGETMVVSAASALLHEDPLRVGRFGPHFLGPSAGATRLR